MTSRAEMKMYVLNLDTIMRNSFVRSLFILLFIFNFYLFINIIIYLLVKRGMFTMQRIAQIIDTTIKQEAHLKPSPVMIP